MSESEIHCRLVEATLRAIQRWAPVETLNVWADQPSIREYQCPFDTGQVQADVIAIRRDTRFVIIGEAKTRRDVDTLHTRKQLKEYYEFLLTRAGGLLWFSVPLGSGGEALRVAKSIRREVKCERVELFVSEWLLGADREIETRWHV